MVVWWHALLTALWGGLLALERRAFLQAMISRPLVAGAGTGFLLNDVTTGLYIGVLFELLHLGGVSLGGSHAHHETLPTVAAAAMASAMGHAAGSSGTPAMWSLSVLLFAPSGWVGRRLESRLDVRARKYVGRAHDANNVQAFRRVARQNLRAMWPQFGFYGVLSGFACVLGYVVAPLEQTMPVALLRGLAWAYPAMSVVAAAIAVQGSRARGRSVIASVSALVVSLVSLIAWYRSGS
jgi:PTS system mannose-specific IIC component